jgi:hypothetical protein
VEHVDKCAGAANGHEGIPKAASTNEPLCRRQGWFLPELAHARRRQERAIRGRPHRFYPPVLCFRVGWFGPQENNRFAVVPGSEDTSFDDIQKKRLVGVVVIAREESDNSVGVPLENGVLATAEYRWEAWWALGFR